MYSNEAIIKTVSQLKSAMAKYEAMAPETLNVSISKGNRKIGRVLNVSLAPIITCHNCKECKHFCYDIKACLQYSNVREARAKNTVLALKHRRQFFEQVEAVIRRRRKNKFFRWHVSGDIPDMDYFENMVRIARNHPDFIFWTYTKNYAVVNEYVKNHGGPDCIPENLSIMFSEWDGMKCDNPYKFPEFTVRLKAGNKNHGPEYFERIYTCPGNCEICLAARRGCPYRETSKVDEH